MNIKELQNKNIEYKNSFNDYLVVLGEDNWHHGVIGIVASKIAEKYFKPTILICFEDGIGKGSGRSLPGFDLHEALYECENLLDKYGGHEMAVGLSLYKKEFENFKSGYSLFAPISDIIVFLLFLQCLHLKNILPTLNYSLLRLVFLNLHLLLLHFLLLALNL